MTLKASDILQDVPELAYRPGQDTEIQEVCVSSQLELRRKVAASLSEGAQILRSRRDRFQMYHRFQ